MPPLAKAMSQINSIPLRATAGRVRMEDDQCNLQNG